MSNNKELKRSDNKEKSAVHDSKEKHADRMSNSC